MTDDLYLIACGNLGNNICFRVDESTHENDMFTCAVSEARRFTRDEVREWMLNPRAMISDRVIPANLVDRNIRKVFTIEHMVEADRIALFRFWENVFN